MIGLVPAEQYRRQCSAQVYTGFTNYLQTFLEQLPKHRARKLIKDLKDVMATMSRGTAVCYINIYIYMLAM